MINKPVWTKGLDVAGLAVEPSIQHKRWLHVWRQGLGSEGYQKNQTWEDGPSRHPVEDKLFVTSAHFFHWQIDESLFDGLPRLYILDRRL